MDRYWNIDFNGHHEFPIQEYMESNPQSHQKLVHWKHSRMVRIHGVETFPLHTQFHTHSLVVQSLLELSKVQLPIFVFVQSFESPAIR